MQSEAFPWISEALGYLERVVKYGFYSSGKMSSAGSDPGSSPKKGSKDDDIDTGKEYPENKENRPDKKKEKPEADPIPEEKMDPERMERLDKRYDGLFNL